RDRRARTGAGDHQRVLLVAHGREDKLVVRPVERSHRTRCVDRDETDADAASGDGRAVAQHPAACPRGRHAFRPCRVELLERREEPIELEPPGAVRNQRLDRDVFELAGKAEQPSEDQRLARHVHARQVLAWVRLGIALGDRPLERRGERGAAAQLPEQVAERPRRAALDLRHPVARFHELLVRIDDGQAGAHGRLEQQPAAVGLGGGAERVVLPLVGGDGAIMGASARPICPKPSSTTSLRSGCATAPPPIFESWKAACTTRWARGASLPSTTSDRFSSDDPWAVAITLIPASARAEKTRAAMPGVSAMPSPTTTSVARPVRASTPSISCRAISRWNVCSRLRRARCALSSGTLKQIECSDEAWVMSDTEIPSWCTAAKVRAAMPGTPSMPLPVTVSSACFGMAESA